MKSTRRRLLTALTGLIALPVLPRAASTSGRSSPPSAPDTLRDCLASQRFPQPRAIQQPPHFDIWEAIPRHPFTLVDVESREEFIRCELHALRVTDRVPGIGARLEAALRECHLARQILHHQPTGRPFVFKYHGGTTPSRERTVLPTLLFQSGVDTHHDSSPATNHFSPFYLQAYCIERLAPRTFRLDRIQNLTPLAPAPI